MNQILLNVLAHDPTNTPGICLSFRWLLPFIPHLETIFGFFIFPLLGTWLGYFFIDTNDLWDQVFSLTGLLYMGTLIGMLPKVNTSSRLWFHANLFTVVCYSIYFAELKTIAYFCMELEYSISWIFDIGFSTALTLLFYGILLCCKLSTPMYFRTIVSIYLLSDLGNLLALVTLNHSYSNMILIFLSLMLVIYISFTNRLPMSMKNDTFILDLGDNSLVVFRCIFWGIMSVWVDFLALSPLYILECIIAGDSHRRKDSVLYFCKIRWESHLSKILENIRKTIFYGQRKMTFRKITTQGALLCA